MKTQDSYKHWSYLFTHYLPVTPEGGGAVIWEKKTEYREIYLPADVEDPDRYLQQLGSDNYTDLLEYSCFSDLAEG